VSRGCQGTCGRFTSSSLERGTNRRRRTDEVADEGVVEVLDDAVEEAQHGEDEALGGDGIEM